MTGYTTTPHSPPPPTIVAAPEEETAPPSSPLVLTNNKNEKSPPAAVPSIVLATEEARPPLPPPPIPTDNKFQLGGDDGTPTTSGMVDKEAVGDTADKAKKETDDDVSVSYNNIAALVAKWKDNPLQPWEGYKDPGLDDLGASPPQTNTGPTVSEWAKTVPDHGHSSSYLTTHYRDNEHPIWDMWIRNWPQYAATA